MHNISFSLHNFGGKSANSSTMQSNLALKRQDDNFQLFGESKPLADDGRLSTEPQKMKPQKVKEKILRQITNMYKTTRMIKYTMQEIGTYSPITLEYKKLKGLVLNVEKRVCWYLNIQPEGIKCLLIGAATKNAKVDLPKEDFERGKFCYYIKAMILEGEEKCTICIPLYGLNINVA